MILSLAAWHTSIFKTPRQAFFKSAHKRFFVSFLSFYQRIFLATFYLILVNLPMQIFVGPYIYTHMDILSRKKAHARIFLRQIKSIAHDNFSVCLQDTNSFYHGLRYNFFIFLTFVISFIKILEKYTVYPEASESNNFCKT